MRKSQLSISLCHAHCPQCHMPVDFQMFESGPGGDFSTYVGQVTQDVYRVNVSKAAYIGNALQEILAPAIEREGNLRLLHEVPSQVKCKLCGNIFAANECAVDGEEIIGAYEL